MLCRYVWARRNKISESLQALMNVVSEPETDAVPRIGEIMGTFGPHVSYKQVRNRVRTPFTCSFVLINSDCRATRRKTPLLAKGNSLLVVSVTPLTL